MKHAKQINPPKKEKFGLSPEIGKRAAEFVDSLPSKFYPKAWSAGILEIRLYQWRRGTAPTIRDLLKLADKGADLNYILTGKRVTE